MIQADDNDDDNANESAALWNHVTRDIKAFHDKKSRVQETPTKKKRKDPSVSSSLAPIVPPVPPVVKKTEAPSSPSLSPPSGREVDGRTAQRMQRGKMPIEARLDLHSLTQEEARQTLESFITRSYEQGMRHVLVITGKGLNRSKKEQKNEEEWWTPAPGILKRRVPDWLNEKPLREIVLQFHKARPQHGGDGALYILLRRRRRQKQKR